MNVPASAPADNSGWTGNVAEHIPDMGIGGTVAILGAALVGYLIGCQNTDEDDE